MVSAEAVEEARAAGDTHATATPPQDVFNNYFSIGSDADTALRVLLLRLNYYYNNNNYYYILLRLKALALTLSERAGKSV
jgi:hypothetical protein